MTTETANQNTLDRAEGYFQTAQTAQQNWDLTLAESSYRAALDLRRQLLGANDLLVAAVQFALAELLSMGPSPVATAYERKQLLNAVLQTTMHQDEVNSPLGKNNLRALIKLLWNSPKSIGCTNYEEIVALSELLHFYLAWEPATIELADLEISLGEACEKEARRKVHEEPDPISLSQAMQWYSMGIATHQKLVTKKRLPSLAIVTALHKLRQIQHIGCEPYILLTQQMHLFSAFAPDCEPVLSTAHRLASLVTANVKQIYDESNYPSQADLCPSFYRLVRQLDSPPDFDSICSCLEQAFKTELAACLWEEGDNGPKITLTMTDCLSYPLQAALRTAKLPWNSHYGLRLFRGCPETTVLISENRTT